jgi:diketogulonate reductase-like aldo/keto reductase
VIRKRAFGSTGVEVPVLGQGTWQIRDKLSAAEALRVGFDLGLTHVDTAELYRGSEEVIAEALVDRRDEMFLVSKVLPHHASFKGTLDACEKSLARLRTDRLDVYLQHWTDGSFPIEDTMRAFGELIDRGKVRFAGVSNFDVAELEEAKAALGRHKLACNQVYYAMEARGIENDVIPWCKRNGVAIVGYSPFGSTGGFPPEKSRGGKVIREVAARVGRTPHQVVLSFLARDPSVFLIPKAEKAAHVRDNAGGDFDLPEAEIDALDAAFPARGGLTFL